MLLSGFGDDVGAGWVAVRHAFCTAHFLSQEVSEHLEVIPACLVKSGCHLRNRAVKQAQIIMAV